MGNYWVFERVGPMGGSASEAFTTPAQGSGIPPADLLARESIQNSVDAVGSSDASKVRVEFVQKLLVGTEKRQFLDTLNLGPALEPRKHALPRNSDSRAHFLEEVDEESASMRLLYVSDFNTTGLSGDPRSNKSHFHRLLLTLGDGSKARGEKDSGGSFGFGKAAYAANSLVHTIVAYTVFDPAESGGDGASARLMGCTYLFNHSIGETEYTGRGWFGVPEPGNQIVNPFNNEDAHSMAESLGFKRRSPDQYGTSILIVDCPIEIPELKRAVETWWWPRIVDHQLDVRLIDHELKSHPPRLKQRDDLKPFINCYEIVVERDADVPGISQRDALRTREGIKPGVAAYQVLDTSPQDVGDEESPFVDSLALIRSLKMVIEYKHYGRMPVPVAGTFLADAEIDKILRSSEPLTHDRWDPNSARENGPFERGVVDSLLGRLKRNFRNFSSRAAPPPPKTSAKATVLESMLGKLFRPRPKNASKGEGNVQDPFRVVFETKPHVVDRSGELSIEGSVGLGLAEHAPSDSVEVVLILKCLPVEDTGVDPHGEIPLRIKCNRPDRFRRESGNTSRVFATITKLELLTFDFQSEPYQPDWTVTIDVDVEELSR